MSWFRRKEKNIQTENSEKKDIKEGLWVKCPSCRQILYKAELMQSNNVCYKCGYHFRISAVNYIDLLLDTEGRQQHFKGIKSLDPLKFKAQKKYSEQLIAAQQRTGQNEAVQVYEGFMFEKPIVVAVMDFSFIGGSMGSAVGELLARSVDLSREKKIPLIVVSASGGARMMEGAYSLMQMAKTSAKLSQLADAKIPYISIMTDPTTGGVTASFAMLGDVNIAEPGALIGFAGERVIKQTIGTDLPEGFQRAEFLLEKGFLDLIVPRDDLKKKVAEIIDILHAPA
ncbi:MAG: acetyl-CoA carboxylase, carboxyltransferase subunit beta [Candidatus Marinimicrobia bacterium]|nr:acetyl-CoA carboxylase, carboxyltransferase subunit beta [Candidatus Neomarinimicrobiota bacterium]MCF7922136.1 acetyl-CoA carboxylase, carboxyltransferase subunit beta [Candidatus Neomarinimicrobiota bacterium]